MTEKRSFSDQLIIDCLNANYGIAVAVLTLLPLGADMNASVYKAHTHDQTSYFVKLKRGHHHDIGIEIVELIDGCHHLPAFSFEQIARRTKAKFITGLSATVTRKDGHHPIILMRCWPIRYRVDAKGAAAMRPFEHTVFVCPTSFSPTKPANEDTRLRFHELYEEIIQDEVRNHLICTDVINAVQRGRSPIILTERTDHLERLFHKLSPYIRHLIVLRGGMSSKEIVAATDQIANIPANEP